MQTVLRPATMETEITIEPCATCGRLLLPEEIFMNFRGDDGRWGVVCCHVCLEIALFAGRGVPETEVV